MWRPVAEKGEPARKPARPANQRSEPSQPANTEPPERETTGRQSGEPHQGHGRPNRRSARRRTAPRRTATATTKNREREEATRHPQSPEPPAESQQRRAGTASQPPRGATQASPRRAHGRARPPRPGRIARPGLPAGIRGAQSKDPARGIGTGDRPPAPHARRFFGRAQRAGDRRPARCLNTRDSFWLQFSIPLHAAPWDFGAAYTDPSQSTACAPGARRPHGCASVPVAETPNEVLSTSHVAAI